MGYAARIFIFAVISFGISVCGAAGFDGIRSDFKSKQEKRKMAVVGKTLWVYFGTDGCKFYPTRITKTPSVFDSRTYKASEPVKVEVAGIVKSGDVEYYRLVINDSEEAYEHVGVSGLADFKENPSDADLKKYCVFDESPELVTSRLSRVEAEKKALAEKIARDAEAAREYQETLSRRPGVRIGMTKKQVIDGSSWGKPDHINTTTFASGTKEQWVYGAGSYLYFTNGKLTAIQN